MASPCQCNDHCFTLKAVYLKGNFTKRWDQLDSICVVALLLLDTANLTRMQGKRKFASLSLSFRIIVNLCAEDEFNIGCEPPDPKTRTVDAEEEDGLPLPPISYLHIEVL